MLRIHEDLVKRLRVIPNPEVHWRIQSSSDPFLTKWCVHIDWEEDGSFAGGRISIGYARIIRGFAIGPPSVYRMVTGVGVDTRQVGENPLVRNVFEGFSAILTAVATVNAIALETELGVVHIARANGNSRAFFERFKEAGIYDHCNFAGERLGWEKSVSGYTFYSAQYPITGLEPLERFVIPEARDMLLSCREEVMRAQVEKSEQEEEWRHLFISSEGLDG